MVSLKLSINGKVMRIILDVPKKKSDYAVLFIPGISGGSLSPGWDRLAAKFRDSGFYFLRYESWKNGNDLSRSNIGSLQKEITVLLKMLERKGCKRLGIIGKSFGGGLGLMYLNKRVEKMVLWAPAIGIDKTNNLKEWKNRKLSQLSSLTGIKIDKKYLSLHEEPILIIHGTKDETMPIENSLKLVHAGRKIKLKRLEGADHSYGDKKYRNKIIDLSISFFKT